MHCYNRSKSLSLPHEWIDLGGGVPDISKEAARNVCRAECLGTARADCRETARLPTARPPKPPPLAVSRQSESAVPNGSCLGNYSRPMAGLGPGGWSTDFGSVHTRSDVSPTLLPQSGTGGSLWAWPRALVWIVLRCNGDPYPMDQGSEGSDPNRMDHSICSLDPSLFCN